MPPTLIIDTFRAATTACHVLSQQPALYLYTDRDEVIAHLVARHADAVLVGRPEVGHFQRYDLPNSPTCIDEADLRGRVVLHRSSAGAVGLLQSGRRDAAQPAALVGLCNLSASVVWAAATSPERPIVRPMGHEATRPSVEDDLTAELIARRVAEVFGGSLEVSQESSLALSPSDLAGLRAGPGRYFFEGDPRYYPPGDFDLCTTLDGFNVAVVAEHWGDHVRLCAVAPGSTEAATAPRVVKPSA